MLGLEVSSLPHSLENLLERKNFAGLFQKKWWWVREAFTILVRGAGGIVVTTKIGHQRYLYWFSYILAITHIGYHI